MSETSKEKLTRTKEVFEQIAAYAERRAEQSETIDKHLAEKIRKAGESAHEVVKHIEKRSG